MDRGMIKVRLGLVLLIFELPNREVNHAAMHLSFESNVGTRCSGEFEGPRE